MLSRAKFRLSPSAYLTKVGALVWGIFLLCSYTIAGASWWTLAYALFAAWVIVSWLWRYAWLKASSSVVAMSWTPEGFCCYLASGDAVEGTILPKSAFNPWLITLHLVTLDGRRYWWPLMADSGPTDALRRLRVFGRWYRQQPTASQS